MKYQFKENKITDQFNPDTGLYEKSNGGTEQQYRHLMTLLTEEEKDKVQIICSRVRNIIPNKKHILWLHDMWADPENEHLSDPKSLERFDKIVFVSYDQFTKFNLMLNVPYDKSIVLRNAIEPIDCPIKRNDDIIRLVYHTTPHRGLQILVPVFKHLYEKLEGKIHLDVFSSFGVYGWKARDIQFEPLFEECKNHPGITYHGAVSNDIIREHLKTTHIFAYPSIWQETSCIAAIEAMSAGNLIVCPDYGALVETVGERGMMYRWNENLNTHANIFGNTLVNAIKNVKENKDLANLLTFNQNYVKKMYSWNYRIEEWKSLIGSL